MVNDYFKCNKTDELILRYSGSSRESFTPDLSGITYPNPSYKNVRPPIHPAYSIEYVYDGEGTIHHGNGIYTAKKHDAFILHENNYHNYYSNKSDPWKKIWFIGTGSLIRHMLHDYDLDKTVVIPGYNNPFYFEKLVQTMRDDPLNSADKLAVILHSLIADISSFLLLNSAPI